MNTEYTPQEKAILEDLPHFFDPLDEEEAIMQAELENIDLDMLTSDQDHLEKIDNAFDRFTTKRKPINIRVLEHDLSRIKAQAIRKGIPYQTLIGSVLHDYANKSEDAVSAQQK